MNKQKMITTKVPYIFSYEIKVVFIFLKYFFLMIIYLYTSQEHTNSKVPERKEKKRNEQTNIPHQPKLRPT